MRRSLIIARGSLFECVAMVDLLSSKNLIAKESAESIHSEAKEISKILFVTAENLRKMGEKNRDPKLNDLKQGR